MADLRPPLTGYSYWLMPSQSDEAGQLNRLITTLAREFSTQRFDGHITFLPLLGCTLDEDLLTRFARIWAGTCDPLRLRLTRIVTQQSYFKCVYIEVELSEALAQFYQQARAGLQDEYGSEDYQPHLSMVYGDLKAGDREVARSRIAAEIILPMTLTFERVALLKANGYPKDWKILHTYRLKKWR